MADQTYTYKDLILAYVKANFVEHHHPEAKDYYQRLLPALEEGIGIKLSHQGLSPVQADCMTLFQHVARLYGATLRSFLDFLSNSFEKSTIRAMGDDGEAVARHLDQFRVNIQLSLKPLHATLDDLFHLMFGEVDTKISSAELLALGMDNGVHRWQSGWFLAYQQYGRWLTPR